MILNLEVSVRSTRRGLAVHAYKTNTLFEYRTSFSKHLQTTNIKRVLVLKTNLLKNQTGHSKV